LFGGPVGKAPSAKIPARLSRALRHETKNTSGKPLDVILVAIK
jgi:hypothetical protein